MKKMNCFLKLFCCLLILLPLSNYAKEMKVSDYVILTSKAVRESAEWMKVVEILKEKHNAQVFYYEKLPRENLSDLKRVKPRYVAIVEQPKYLNRDYIIDLNMLSREVDEDIYADFLWGIITGYDADAAIKMVDNSTEPLVIKDAISTIMELNSAKWFDHYAWIDDHQKALFGQKEGKGELVQTEVLEPNSVWKKFSDIYTSYNPDLVVTAFHASQSKLEIPYYLGEVICKEGKLYIRGGTFEEEAIPLKETGKRKVYFAVGNCLIGDVANSRNSMAIAWMSGGYAATMIGYVVPTWHGRNGWGGLKYWLTTPGRYTLAEAIFLNQQDFLNQQYQWYPSLIKEKYPHSAWGNRQEGIERLKQVTGKEKITNDELGFWYDRDVLAFYGDPKWNVRLQEIPEENDFTVMSKIKGKKCIITIKTNKNFSLERMKGDHFKEEHVLDIPFSYFFPTRLKNPRLAAGQDWKVAMDENFLLVYEPDFAPGNSYTIVLDFDK